MRLGHPFAFFRASIELVVEFAVVFHDTFVGEFLLGFDHDAGDLGVADFVGELVEGEGLVDGPAQSFGREVFKEEAVAGALLDAEV